jgi:hypothetical protein
MQATLLSSRRRSGGRVALAVLAILALSLLPLRTLCELEVANAAQTAGEHQTGGGDSDLCCASIGDTALLDSVVPALPAGSGAASIVALLASSLILAGFVVQRPRLAGVSPPARSYYARSARVLR